MEHLQYNWQEENVKNFLNHANLSVQTNILLTYNTLAIQAKILWTHDTDVIILTHATRTKIRTTPLMRISRPE